MIFTLRAHTHTHTHHHTHITPTILQVVEMLEVMVTQFTLELIKYGICPSLTVLIIENQL